MAVSTVCRHCNDWTPGQTDRFCGGCGAFIAPVTLSWRVDEGEASIRRIALAAEAPSDWSTDDRDDLMSHAVRVETPDGRIRDEGLTLGGLIHAETTPLIDVERDVRGGVAATFLARVGRAAPSGARAADLDVLAALALSETSPVLSFPTAEAAMIQVTGRAGLTLRIRNWGGDFVATRARLRFGAETGRETALPRPTLLRGEAESLVRIVLDPVDQERALASDGVLEADLELLDGDESHAVGRMQLASPAHPEASLTTPREVPAMAGTYARMALRLRNVGGETLRFMGGVITVTGADEIRHEWSLAEIWTGPETLGRDEVADVEIRPWMTVDGTASGATLAVGRHAFQMRVRLAAAGGDRLEAVAQGRLLVKEPRAFVGRICIDFGTTESAAAVGFGVEVDVDDGEALEPPTIIELGRVGVGEGPDGGGRRFLPTVAYDHDGKRLHGGEALRVHAAAEDPGPLIRRFKWRLGDAEGEKAASDYLTHVRELIERHPKVAALVTPDTPVVATRPTDFADGQNEALLRAFATAGFGDPRRSGFATDGTATLVYESWSPAILALWGDEAPLMRRLSPGLERQTAPASLPQDLSEPVLIVIYDVGGGSADLSVLKVEPSPDEVGLVLISEVFKRTDLDFVGVRFEELVLSALTLHVDDQGKAPDRRPAAEPVWQDAVRAIQHVPGLFSGDIARLARDQLSGALKAASPSLGFADALRQRWGLGASAAKELPPSIRDEMRAIGPLLLKLRLPTDDDDLVEVTLSDLPLLLEKVLVAFAARYVEPMRALTDELMTTSGLNKMKRANTRLIPSGRGGAFPLARALILALFEGKIGPTLQPVPDAAKSVTSYGALHLADVAALEGEIRFDLNRERRTYSVVLGRKTRGQSKGWRRHALEDLGRGAVVRLADLPPSLLKQPLRVDAAWPRSSNHDRVANIEVTPAAAAAAEKYWLVSWRDGHHDAARLIEAGSAEEAVERAREIAS